MQRLAPPLLAILGGCATTVATVVPPPSYVSGYSEQMPCVDRIGRCFDATIGGKPVSVIADKAQFVALRAQLKELNDNVRETYWIVNEPIEGKVALDVETRANPLGAALVGEPKEEPDVTVYALDGQDLDSKPELVTNNSVRINGQPVVTKQETLTQDFLPPGRYVLAIKHIGKKNWDRKWVLITVK